MGRLNIGIFLVFLAMTGPAKARDTSLEIGICETVFVKGSYNLRLESDDVYRLFHAEYQSLDMGYYEDIKLDYSNVRKFSDSAPLYALNGFKITHNYIYHELSSSNIYARTLEKRGELLLFLSKYGDQFVPGFDGIVYHKSGVPVANYSLKATRTNWLGAVSEAETKAKLYSENEMEWFNSLTGSDFDQNSNFVYDGSKWNKYYDSKFKSIVYLTKLFGVPVSKCGECLARPTRIVVHLTQRGIQNITKREIRIAVDKIRNSNGVIESITVMNHNKILEITAKGPRVFDL